MQVVIFLFRAVRADADIVEDAGGKGRGKTERGERFPDAFPELNGFADFRFSGRP